jgi:hypothetical protein
MDKAKAESHRYFTHILTFYNNSDSGKPMIFFFFHQQLSEAGHCCFSTEVL